MRHTRRLLAGLVLAGGLALVPAAGTLHAAPATGKGAAAETRENGQPRVFFPPDYIASVEGVSTAVLQQDLQAGQTLLQIAGSKYSSASELATALVAPFKMKLDRVVAAGKLTADQESQQYTALLNAAETLVVTPHPVLAPPPDRRAGGGKMRVEGTQGAVQPEIGNVKFTMISAVATSCNTTTDALLAAAQAGGKSILAACQATNPNATVDSLSAAITTAVKAQLDTAVSSGKLTASQESEILSGLQSNLSTWLTTPITNSDSSHQKA